MSTQGGHYPTPERARQIVEQHLAELAAGNEPTEQCGRLAVILGGATDTTARRSSDMNHLADCAALVGAIVELLDEIIDSFDLAPAADGNWQRHGDTVMAVDDAWHARDAARLSAAAFARAASL